jgi:hypothetical protein
MKFVKRPTLTVETGEIEVKTSLLRRIFSLNQERTTKAQGVVGQKWENVVIDFSYQPVAIGMHMPVLEVEDAKLYNVVPVKFLDNQFIVECSISYAELK